MLTGTIRKKTEKGFGFIKVEDGGEVFFHARQCITLYDSLKENDRVQFDTKNTDKGLRAIQVKRL